MLRANLIRIKCAGQNRYKLERFSKTKYFRDIYSLTDSFRLQMSMTNHLAGRAGQKNFLEPLPPPAWAMTEAWDFIIMPARTQKGGRNNTLLVDSAYRNKSRSIIQTNFIIKAVKGKKLPKWWKGLMTSRFLLPPLFRKSCGDKTTNAVYIKKALAKFLVIFKAERSVLSYATLRTI